MKKTATLLMVLLMFSVVLWGCSDSSESDTSSQPSTVEENTDGAVSEEQPVVLDPYTVTIYYPGDPQKDEALVEQTLTDYLKDSINVQVDLNPIPWGDWGNKINLMSASGEPFDLLFTAGWDNFLANVNKKIFLPLDDLYEQYGKGAQQVIAPEVLNDARVNGELYALPVIKDLAQSLGLIINKDMADKYDMDLSTITSIRDLEPLLAIIKENEPNAIPFYPQAMDSGHFSDEGSDTVGGNKVPGIILPGETTVVNEWELPWRQEHLSLMHQWYQNGFIPRDAATNHDINSAYSAKRVFAATSGLKPGKAEEMSAQYGSNLVQIETKPPTIDNLAGQGAMTAISRTSQNPERAMMFLDLLYSDPFVLNTIVFGVEGEHFTKVTDAVITAPEGKTQGETGYNPGVNWMFGYQFINYLWDFEDPEKWQKFIEFNGNAKVSRIAGFVFNNEVVKNEEAAISNDFDQFVLSLITGSLNPEETLPRFIDSMKKNGLDKVLEEKQRQLDAFFASSN